MPFDLGETLKSIYGPVIDEVKKEPGLSDFGGDPNQWLLAHMAWKRRVQRAADAAAEMIKASMPDKGGDDASE